jgi:hypothetical protein
VCTITPGDTTYLFPPAVLSVLAGPMLRCSLTLPQPRARLLFNVFDFHASSYSFHLGGLFGHTAVFQIKIKMQVEGWSDKGRGSGNEEQRLFQNI